MGDIDSRLYQKFQEREHVHAPTGVRGQYRPGDLPREHEIYWQDCTPEQIRRYVSELEAGRTTAVAVEDTLPAVARYLRRREERPSPVIMDLASWLPSVAEMADSRPYIIHYRIENNRLRGHNPITRAVARAQNQDTDTITSEAWLEFLDDGPVRARPVHSARPSKSPRAEDLLLRSRDTSRQLNYEIDSSIAAKIAGLIGLSFLAKEIADYPGSGFALNQTDDILRPIVGAATLFTLGFMQDVKSGGVSQPPLAKVLALAIGMVFSAVEFKEVASFLTSASPEQLWAVAQAPLALSAAKLIFKRSRRE